MPSLFRPGCIVNAQGGAPDPGVPLDRRASITSTAGAFCATLVARSENTARAYQTSLRQFGEFIGPGSTVDELTISSLEDFYVSLRSTVSRSTASLRLAAAKQYVRWLIRHQLIDPGLATVALENARVVAGKTPYHPPRVDRFTPAKLVGHADAIPLPAPGRRSSKYGPGHLEVLRDRALLHTLFSTGIRRAEACSLNRSDVDGQGEAIIRGKGDKDRAIFLSQEALAAIRAYVAARADAEPALFLRHHHGGREAAGGRLSPLAVWLIVKRNAAAAGVECHPHSFRHALASNLLNAGARLEEVQDVLGHASPEITKKVYAHYDRGHIRNVMERYRPTVASLVGAGQ